MYVISKQKGLSIVELMIALVLGLVVTGAVVQVFANNKQMYRMQDANARLQENGRYAIHTIAEKIRKAGFKGCVTRSKGGNLVSTLNTPTGYLYDFSTSIEGARATGTNTWSPALHSSIVNALTGNDVLTIRYTDGPMIKVVTHPISSPTGSANLTVDTGNGLVQNDIVLVSNCETSRVFQITSANPSTTGVIAHAASGTMPGNATATLGKIYANGEIIKLQTVSFYIRNNADGIPTLWQVIGSAPPEEVIEGVENLDIEYGIDTDGDTAVDNYVTADVASADWDQVISVRVTLDVRTLEDNVIVDTTATNTYLTAQFSRTISLRNNVP